MQKSTEKTDAAQNGYLKRRLVTLAIDRSRSIQVHTLVLIERL